MESFYTKYRPAGFEDVVGQTHVVRTLIAAVKEQRLSHAYLFCGPRGTGKTTMARLLAKALVCQKGPGLLPDGTCEQCRLVARGMHPDVIELDAASRTGVDNVRDEIISRVNYAPTLGRAKVYIIDEVHMLSPAAFNALLKTLEEPPAHVTFVLCTTDPQKILATILSRVQRFDFHGIAVQEISAYLVKICDCEGFSYQKEALDMLARRAHGGMRDALTSLEQISVYGSGTIDVHTVEGFFGKGEQNSYHNIISALAKGDIAAIFMIVGDLVDEGKDVRELTKSLMSRVRDVYVCSLLNNPQKILNADASDIPELIEEARSFGSPEKIARTLVDLDELLGRMRSSSASERRLMLESAFVRLILQTGTTVSTESCVDVKVEPQIKEKATVTAKQPPEPLRISEPDSVSAADSAPALSQEAPLGALGPWELAVRELAAKLPAQGSLLQGSVLVDDDGSSLRVSLTTDSRFAVRMLERADVRDTTSPVIEKYFGKRKVVYVGPQKNVASFPESGFVASPGPALANPLSPPETSFSASPKDTEIPSVAQKAPDNVPSSQSESTNEPADAAKIEKKANSAAKTTPARPKKPRKDNEFLKVISLLTEAFGKPVDVTIEDASKDSDV